MGTHAADGAHELVVAPELAEVAERLGVPLHVGDRVRFKVIQEGLPDNGPAHRETWPPVGAGSIITDDERLAEQVRETVRAAVQDPFGHQRRPLGPSGSHCGRCCTRHPLTSTMI